ncbi:hypothetical protein DPMN_100837 [Dreissena polymorpha]|uniref:Uncharacterized protein n=1 Tax=Dreissena polymorpha TaxID=45954 RepID=A0A9D4LGG9_DREPO|nr:hypothetical protein DPMN_100837 [Dreissena polymorpha]
MIGETLDDICEGRITIEDLPKIEVAKHDEKWVTNDNRRLWVFKQLERLGKCETVEVWIVSSVCQIKLTTNNGGESIKVRGFPGGIWHLKASKTSLD